MHEITTEDIEWASQVVEKLTRKWHTPYSLKDDLHSAANLGLVKASKRFSRQKAKKLAKKLNRAPSTFKTYAMYWILKECKVLLDAENKQKMIIQNVKNSIISIRGESVFEEMKNKTELNDNNNENESY